MAQFVNWQRRHLLRRHLVELQGSAHPQAENMLREFLMGNHSASGRRHTPLSILNQLPVRTLTASEVRQIAERGADENLSSCLVCLSDYEADEEVRTMPCLHFFHTVCIDKWLSKSISCPICKFDICANYNNTGEDD